MFPEEKSAQEKMARGDAVPQAAQLSCAALAYLGDSVLELLTREHLTRLGLSTAAHLNAAARDYVTAGAQAQAMKRILPSLSEQEAAVFRRGRNNVHSGVPKRATVGEYRAATGMEALFGFLYLSGQMERARELFALGYPEPVLLPSEPC